MPQGAALCPKASISGCQEAQLEHEGRAGGGGWGGQGVAGEPGFDWVASVEFPQSHLGTGLQQGLHLGWTISCPLFAANVLSPLPGDRNHAHRAVGSMQAPSLVL